MLRLLDLAKANNSLQLNSPHPLTQSYPNGTIGKVTSLTALFSSAPLSSPAAPTPSESSTTNSCISDVSSTLSFDDDRFSLDEFGAAYSSERFIYPLNSHFLKHLGFSYSPDGKLTRSDHKAIEQQRRLTYQSRITHLLSTDVAEAFKSIAKIVVCEHSSSASNPGKTTYPEVSARRLDTIINDALTIELGFADRASCKAAFHTYFRLTLTHEQLSMPDQAINYSYCERDISIFNQHLSDYSTKHGDKATFRNYRRV